VDDVEHFFRVVRAGFSQRRKQLHNSLAAGLRLGPRVVTRALHEAGIDPRRRAERLSVEDWRRVTKALKQLARDFQD
jgi:16S rRNA (adenine1518-N6/adenine1519-N6)-dimethyltransferase